MDDFFKALGEFFGNLFGGGAPRDYTDMAKRQTRDATVMRFDNMSGYSADEIEARKQPVSSLQPGYTGGYNPFSSDQEFSFNLDAPSKLGGNTQRDSSSPFDINFLPKDLPADPINKKATMREILNDVDAGKWGEGDERWENLYHAGYDSSFIKYLYENAFQKGEGDSYWWDIPNERYYKRSGDLPDVPNNPIPDDRRYPNVLAPNLDLKTTYTYPEGLLDVLSIFGIQQYGGGSLEDLEEQIGRKLTEEEIQRIKNSRVRTGVVPGVGIRTEPVPNMSLDRLTQEEREEYYNKYGFWPMEYGYTYPYDGKTWFM